MKKILLPTDFSANAYNAIKYAVQLLKDEKCTFYLLNTYTPVLYDSEYILYNTTHPSLDEVYEANSKKGLREVSQKIQHSFPNSNHSFKEVSSFNMLNDEIKTMVEEEEIDLVIMGTQGATGAEEILFGTHTVHVIKKAFCPVLAVPSEYQYKTPENILFPTDYNLEYREEHLEILKLISAKFQSKVCIFHVYSEKELSPRQEDAKKLLETKLEDTNHEFYGFENKSLTDAIARAQKEKQIDLLAMINNKHSFFENLLFRPTIDKIGFHTKVPFLVIPTGKNSHEK